MPVGFKLFGAELTHLCFRNPGGVGGTAGTVGEHETAGGFPRKPSAIGDCPMIQLAHDGTISKSSEGKAQSHNKEFSNCCHFEEKIRVFRAEIAELLIGHGWDRQHCRQVGLFNQECHCAGLTRLRSKSVPRPWLEGCEHFFGGLGGEVVDGVGDQADSASGG